MSHHEALIKMAFLRRSVRLVQPFTKLSIACQTEYTRRIISIAPTQGYATVSPKFCYAFTSPKKAELPDKKSKHDDSDSNSIIDMNSILLNFSSNMLNGKISIFLRTLENFSKENSKMNHSISLAMLNQFNCNIPYLKLSDHRIYTEKVWNVIKQKTKPLTLDHYHTLLSIYVHSKQQLNPESFVKNMKVKPDENTYRLLLNAVAKSGDTESAQYVVSVMKSTGYKIDAKIFNLLIETYANNKDMEEALTVFDNMKKLGIEPNAETYMNLAYGYALIGDIENIKKILDSYRPSVPQIIQIVKRLSIANHSNHIPKIFKYLPSVINQPDSIFADTISELILAEKPEDAFEIVNLFSCPDSSTEYPIYERFLKDMVHGNIPKETVLELTDKIATLKNYPMAFMHVCEASLRSGNVDLALSTLEAMHKKNIEIRSHYYWPLLIRASKTEGEAGIFKILKHMTDLNVKLDHETLVNYVFRDINLTDPYVTLKKFRPYALDHSLLFTALICTILYRGEITKTLELCKKIQIKINFEKVIEPLVRAFVVTKRSKQCAQLFQYAQKEERWANEFLNRLYNEVPSPRNMIFIKEFLRTFESLNIPVSSFNEPDQEKSTESKDPPHPSDMNLEELECHLIELKAKGMNTRGVLRKLLQKHCTKNDMKRVDEIKKEYDENGFLWTGGMYSNLLQLYAENDRIDEALEVYENLKEYWSSFIVDDFKILSLATALMRANRVEEAMDLIAETSSKGGERLKKNVWEILNTVAHGSRPELTEKMLELLVEKGYCEISNTAMGPVIRVHLLKNDLESAVQKFEECAARYGHNPLRQELVHALVKAINADKDKKDLMGLLQKVQTIITQLRGESVAKMDLFLALARNEMRKELQNFLKVPLISCVVQKSSLNFRKILGFRIFF